MVREVPLRKGAVCHWRDTRKRARGVGESASVCGVPAEVTLMKCCIFLSVPMRLW